MKAIAIAGFVLATTAAAHGGQQSLGAAKDLYASAAYEEALSTFIGLYESAPPEVRRQIDEYRTFCLFALGRTAEAEALAESLIRSNPLLHLDEAETPPRIQTMFAAVRKRLLPDLIRIEYRAARAARDAKNAKTAEPHLVAARDLLDEARNIGAWTDALAEVSELVDGFLDLARATRPDSRRLTTAPGSGLTDGPAALPVAAATPPTSGPDNEARRNARVYSRDDQDVSPPIAIRQAIPNPPRQLLDIMRTDRHRAGKLDVLVDETGAVRDVTIRESLNARFDEMIVAAAQDWSYQPAMRRGVPVKYVKVVNITITDR